jgi:hypothetical protein
MFPGFRNERLLTERQFRMVALILFLDVLGCATLLNPYVPLLPVYLLSILSVFGLALYAKQMPKSFMMPTKDLPDWSPRKFMVLGFLLMTVCFITSAAFIDSGIHPIVPVVLMLAVCWIVLHFIRNHMGRAQNLPQFAYLCAGFVLFLLGIDILVALGGWYDMAFVAIITGLLAFDLVMWSTGRKAVLFLRGRKACGVV